MKAVLMRRVSSKGQESNFSLQGQNTRLSRYAKQKGLQVIKNFELTESATKVDRKQFMEVINFCLAQEETIAILVDGLDRLQRTFNELIMLKELVNAGKIELHFCGLNLVINQYSLPSDIMNWELQIAFAEYQVNNFKAITARGRNQKVMVEHMISWQSPCGYENYIDESGNRTARPKEPEATYLKRLFECYAIGGTSLRQLVDLADKFGLKSRTGKKIGLTSMIKIIDNPFYYGAIPFNGTVYEQAAHTPLISKELWEVCQQQREIQSSKSVKKAEIPFLYRGIFKSYYDDSVCSSETKKEKYTYLACRNENNVRIYINEKDITDQIASILNQITIPQNLIDKYNLYIQSSVQEEMAFKTKERGYIKSEITKIENKLENLLDMRLEGKLSDEKYDNKEQELNAKKSELEEKIQNQVTDEPDSRQIVPDSVPLFSRLGDIFLMGTDIVNKQNLLRLIFKELKIRDGNVGYKFNEPFACFFNPNICMKGGDKNDVQCLSNI